ncbi:ATP-binding protein [Serratia marcescens]|uniref:ATP-binding protein n=1 Tax=Serratia marcescens TaxID=615 RepID=UPI003FA6C01D
MSKITVKAGADHLASLATAKPVTALSELIWNGFDAKSSKVEIIINKNPLFESIDSVVIKDNGEGINNKRVVSCFGNLGESWKKQAKANGDRSLHGQYGRGIGLKRFPWGKGSFGVRHMKMGESFFLTLYLLMQIKLVTLQ